MLYFIKIMTALIAVLAVLAMSLLVVAFLTWDVNSQVILPEILEETSKWNLSGEYIGSYLEVLTGIVALLFPISLSIITDAKGKYFSSQEVTEVVFKQWEYKGLYFVLFILLAVTVASFWEPVEKWVLLLMLCAMTGTLIFLYFFFRKLEEVISDFSLLVREEEKSKIEDLVGNVEN